ncbi:F-box protein At3g59000-like [Sesamum indicum]|uniref:F-box protein At3g59000-like n=1 Tax=Sesamum indicum TaxID=4182 RepID=A0A6I9TYL5_SESIN|nr:F-box protein At3g59000-like [Sesamum indicum]
MEKSSDFVVDTYLLDLPNCYLNRRPRFHAPPLQNVACQPHSAFHYRSLETGGKQQEQEQENGANAGADLDRLSALPDIICQHILSFLPAKDARRTALVSRRWRYMWYACASFTFNEREFHGRPPPLLQWQCSRQNFIRFVDEALEFRKMYFNDLSIEKFKVSMRFVEEVSPCLEKWIAFALERNVKELSIIAEMKDLIAVAEFFHPFRVPYLLPQAVFTTKSIQCLEIVFCDLSNVSGSSIHLPFLRSLDMINVHMNDSIFTSILSGSPLLEKINLSLVCGLERIHVTGEKLKMLVVFKCLPLEEVIVKAPNIESFLFRGKRHSLDKIDISSCRKLKFLWLQRASNLTDDALEKVAALNLNLEVMILSHCSALKNAVVHSPNLWMFVLFKCKHLALVKIEAPNLRAFEYSGHMITFLSVVSSPKLDAIIHMDRPEICSRWYAKLKNMCSRFDHCRSLWIRCEHDIDLIIPHELRKPLLPQLQGLTELKIHVRNGTRYLAQLEDGIRWIFPGLKNLYVESDGSTHHFQYAGAIGDVGPAWRKCRDFIKQENDRF